MEKIVIGVDPHKLSTAIDVDHREKVLTTGRLTTDKIGYAAMRKHVAASGPGLFGGGQQRGRPLAPSAC